MGVLSNHWRERVAMALQDTAAYAQYLTHRELPPPPNRAINWQGSAINAEFPTVYEHLRRNGVTHFEAHIIGLYGFFYLNRAHEHSAPPLPAQFLIPFPDPLYVHHPQPMPMEGVEHIVGQPPLPVAEAAPGGPAPTDGGAPAPGLQLGTAPGGPVPTPHEQLPSDDRGDSSAPPQDDQMRDPSPPPT